MFSEEEWASRIRAIDERLQPIATRPVDMRDPDWSTKLQSLRPLDEAGVRPAADDLLKELIRIYASGDDVARASVRSLFRKFPSFAWAAALATPTTTAQGFREHLLHFSILDQGQDPRDATLWLDHLVRTARAAGVDVIRTLAEVASLSNREDRYSWGSTADWLLRRAASG